MGTGTTRNTASAAVEAVLASILEAAEQQDKVHIPRLGTFQMVERPARTGFDINSGQLTQFPPRQKLTFRPAAALQSHLRK